MGGDENKVPDKQQQQQKQLEPDYKYANYIESSPNMHYQTIESSRNNNNNRNATTNYSATNNYESNPYLPSRNKYGSNNYK